MTSDDEITDGNTMPILTRSLLNLEFGAPESLELRGIPATCSTVKPLLSSTPIWGFLEAIMLYLYFCMA